VESLEYLVDQDPEALVDRRFLGDGEDSRELVLERTGPVQIDIRCREGEAVAAPWNESLE